MINDLLDRIEDLVQDNTLLLVALNEKDEELQLAKEDEAALAQSGVELTAHNTQLQGQVHTLESENHQLKIDHKGMTELYNAADAHGDALFAKNQGLERASTTLLRRSEDKKGTYVARIAGLEASVKREKQLSETLLARRQDLERELASTKEMHRVAQALVDELRDERLRLAGLYNAAHAQANALHVKNTSMQLQLDALRRAYGANSVDAVVKAVKA